MSNPVPRQPRLLCLTVSGLLLFQAAGITRAAAGAWECRASADGAGWDCAPEGRGFPEAAAPSAPALTDAAEAPVPEPPVPAAPETQEPGRPQTAPTLATPAPPEISEEQAPVAETVQQAPETREPGPPPAAPALAAPAPPEISAEQAPVAETAQQAPQPGETAQPLLPKTGVDAAEKRMPEPEPPAITEEKTEERAAYPPPPPGATDAVPPEVPVDLGDEETGVAEALERPEEEEAISVGAATVGRSSLLDEGLSWETCGPLSIPQQSAPEPDAPTTYISADSAEFFQKDEVYTLTGGVELTRGQERAHADHARFDKKNGRLTAKGNVFFEQPNLRFTGDTAELDLPSNQGMAQERRVSPDTIQCAGHRGHGVRGNALPVPLREHQLHHLQTGQ